MKFLTSRSAVMHKARGPNEFITEAYALNDERGLKDFYAKWATDYDEKMLQQGYCSPRVIAEKFIQHQPDRNARVLDLGCGTGLTALTLAEAGYTNLHGIDLSPEMIAVADTRKIYASLQTADITHPLPFPANHFNGIISSGTFTHGHVDASPLPELCRVMAAGAVLACTVHKDLWKPLGFDATFADLVANGKLECLELELGKFYDGGEDEGWFGVWRRFGK